MNHLEIRRLPTPEYRVKEAFNALCTNLLFVDDDVKVIMVTSCFPQEGKSSISVEMMRTMGEMGKRVILVDADIRASDLMEEYDIRVPAGKGKSFRGLSRYLAGGCSVEDIICTTNIKNVSLIPAGRNVVNSLPLFTNERMEALISHLRERYDVIIVDTPPIGTIIDAAKISLCCDGALLVVKSGRVRRRDLANATQQLERTGCPIFGVVLNAFNEDAYGGKDYYNSYYYYYAPETVEPRKRRKKTKEKTQE